MSFTDGQVIDKASELWRGVVRTAAKKRPCLANGPGQECCGHDSSAKQSAVDLAKGLGDKVNEVVSGDKPKPVSVGSPFFYLLARRTKLCGKVAREIADKSTALFQDWVLEHREYVDEKFITKFTNVDAQGAVYHPIPLLKSRGKYSDEKSIKFPNGQAPLGELPPHEAFDTHCPFGVHGASEDWGAWEEVIAVSAYMPAGTPDREPHLKEFFEEAKDAEAAVRKFLSKGK